MTSPLLHLRALMLISALVAVVGVDAIAGSSGGDRIAGVATLVLGVAGVGVALDLRRRDAAARADGPTAWSGAVASPAAMVLAATRAVPGGPPSAAPAAMIRMSVHPLHDRGVSLTPDEADRLLQVAVERARRTLRTGDVVTRVGVYDMAISLHVPCNTDIVTALAERLRDTLLEPVSLDRLDVRLAPRIGVAVDDEEAPITSCDVVETLLRRAEEARGQADGDGGSVMVWRDGHSQVSLRRSELSTRLRRALRVGDISLVYQPIYGVEAGRVTAVEALARWDDVKFGHVSPVEFVGLCESLGLTAQLMRLVLDQAVAQVVEWRSEGLDIGVHVNVSGHDISENRLPVWVGESLRRHDCPPALLTLEITETAVIARPDRVLPTLHALRDIGVHLSLDDYGTGYSSLLYIQKMPIHSLKIDQAFLANLTRSESDEVIVRTSIELAHALGLSVTVEGVEDSTTMARAIEFGTDHIQGYFIGKPERPGSVRVTATVGLRGTA